MIFMLLATIDFGFAFFSWITLRDAAQEGAAYGSMYPPTGFGDLTNIRDRVKYAATTPVNLENLPNPNIVIIMLWPDGTTSPSPVTPCPGNSIRVTVTYDYPVITPMISNFVGAPTIPISASVTNTILRPGNNAGCP
jgi:Flp pilus assembly protein TadG